MSKIYQTTLNATTAMGHIDFENILKSKIIVILGFGQLPLQADEVFQSIACPKQINTTFKLIANITRGISEALLNSKFYDAIVFVVLLTDTLLTAVIIPAASYPHSAHNSLCSPCSTTLSGIPRRVIFAE